MKNSFSSQFKGLSKIVFICFVSVFFVIPSVFALVNINIAGVSELDSLPGISKDTAHRIVEYRTKMGPFSDIEQLRNVKGIGKKTLEKIESFITLEGGSSASTVASNSNVQKPKKPTYTAEEILNRFKSEPTIEQVQKEAVKNAQIHPEDIAKWRQRIHTKVFFPQTKFKVDYYNRENSTKRTAQNIDFRDDPDRYVIGPDEDTITNYDYQYVKYQLQFSWDLDEFIFNRDELRIRSEAEDLVDFRTKVAEDVTKLYFERRRLQINDMLNPQLDPRIKIEKRLRLQELTALIDMMTGGYFLEHINKSGK